MRVGIIGLGVIVKNHIPALLAAGQEIVALCDVDPARIERAKERFNLPNAVGYTDYKQMLDEANLDSVHLCTPHYLHVPMACEALSRNIHVFCEKPMAITHRQLDALESAVKHSSARFGVCQQNRCNPSSRYVKELIGDRSVTAASATMSWKRDRSYYDSEPWRGKWDTEGGGVMINQALHTLDLLQWFCGYPVSVVATTSNLSLSDVIQVEDTAFGRFTLKNGGSFVIHATNASTNNFPIEIMLRVEDDTIVICKEAVSVNGQTVNIKDEMPVLGKAEYGTGHMALIAKFYECLQTGEPFPIDFYEASKVIRLILGMYESNGREIIL